MKKNKYLTKDGNLKYQSIKKLLTATNDLWLAVNMVAKECGVPQSSFLHDPELIATKSVKTVYTPSDIVYKVNKRFGANLKEKSRSTNTVSARFAACHLLAKYTFMSLHDIASEVGVGDHTTVINAKRRAMELISVDEDFKAQIEILENELKKELNSQLN